MSSKTWELLNAMSEMCDDGIEVNRCIIKDLEKLKERIREAIKKEEENDRIK